MLLPIVLLQKVIVTKLVKLILLQNESYFATIYFVTYYLQQKILVAKWESICNNLFCYLLFAIKNAYCKMEVNLQQLILLLIVCNKKCLLQYGSHFATIDVVTYYLQQKMYCYII